MCNVLNAQGMSLTLSISCTGILYSQSPQLSLIVSEMELELIPIVGSEYNNLVECLPAIQFIEKDRP